MESKSSTKDEVFLFDIFCRNNVPDRIILQKRNNAVPVSCLMCDTDVEHLFHVFFDSGFATLCWQRIGIHYDM